MKKSLLSLTLVLAMGLSFTSCRETEKTADEKTIIIKTDDSSDDVSVEKEGALERAGKAVDNAKDEVKDAGKAIDNAAKEITNDDN